LLNLNHPDFTHIIDTEIGVACNCTPLLENWRDSKSVIYEKLLHSNMVQNTPFEYNLSRRQKEFAKRKFLRNMRPLFKEGSDIDTESLLTNRLRKDYDIQGAKFPRDTRTTKLLRTLTVDTGQGEVMKMEKEYAEFIQPIKSLSGKLKISIDPIDFITVSENSYKWNSCHSIRDGDYRAGSLALMSDDNTAICYLEGDRVFKFHDIAVPNKKWRVLIHFFPKVPFVLFNNQYPFRSVFIMSELIKMITKLLKQSYNMDFHHILIRNSELQGILQSDDNEALCNDLIMNVYNELKKTQYTLAIFPVHSSGIKDVSHPIYIGQRPLCPICGDHEIERSGTLGCDYCFPFEYCCICGGREFTNHIVYHDSECYCISCFEDYFTICEICGKCVSIDDDECCNDGKED